MPLSLACKHAHASAHVSARPPGCVRFKDSRPRASHVAPVLGKTAQQRVERRSLSAWGCHPQRVIDDTPWPLRRGHEQIATTGYCCTHPQATGHILFIVLLIIIPRPLVVASSTFTYQQRHSPACSYTTCTHHTRRLRSPQKVSECWCCRRSAPGAPSDCLCRRSALVDSTPPPSAPLTPDTPTLANENSVALIERIITKASLLPAEAEVLRARRDGAGIVYEFEGERWALEDGESGKDGAVGGRERVGARARVTPKPSCPCPPLSASDAENPGNSNTDVGFPQMTTWRLSTSGSAPMPRRWRAPPSRCISTCHTRTGSCITQQASTARLRRLCLPAPSCRLAPRRRRSRSRPGPARAPRPPLARSLSRPPSPPSRARRSPRPASSTSTTCPRRLTR